MTKKRNDIIGVCFCLQNNEVPLQKSSKTSLLYYLHPILIAMFRFHTLRLILVIADLYCNQVLFQ